MNIEIGAISKELVLILLPLVGIQIGLDIYCLIKILKYGTANLNKWIWAAIVIFINLFGAILFLLFGRRDGM